MRYILMFFACLMFSPLIAETIGNVEYHLPMQGQGWKVAEELKGTKKVKSTTVIYIPENASKETAVESFGAHVNNLPITLTDKDAIQKNLEKGMHIKYENPKVAINVLEQTPQSILYEWTLKDSDEEKAYGWTRAFAIPDETVILTYQTEDLSQVNDKRPIWIQALKNAKVTNKTHQ